MPDIVINGISVKFPFEPYSVQQDYMASVIECLNKSENAMLESPTGTGKTLCLLCATLAWVEHNKNDETSSPTVIYASRTHSQIAQAMKELKRSDYNYIEATVIGSRDQLCIHPELKEMSNSDKILECKNLRKRKKCEFYSNFEVHKLEQKESDSQKIMDIEDLLRYGMKHECCSYYFAKKRAKHIKLIFMPYNYLINPLLREAVLKDIDMKNSIVILDEAHNVPNVCEESASTSITTTQIIIALKEMKFIVENVEEDSFKKYETEKNHACNLKSSLHKLLRVINEMQLDNNGTKTHSGNYMFTLLREANISGSDAFLIDKMVEILFENREKKAPQGIGLQAISNLLKIAFTGLASRLNESIDSYYRVYVENEKTPLSQNDDSDTEYSGTRKTVNIWCFSPAFGIQNILGQDIHSMILTSGTLSPFRPIIKEMMIPMPVTLSNSHVIERSQVYATICEVGVKHEKMDGRHDNRDNKKYKMSLGDSIVEVAKVVPDGLLIFFKSYKIMQKHHHFWKSNSIWKKICDQKPIFIEPENKKELKTTMREYYASVDQGNGAIFMAVLRGKVSEGLDFADMYGRGVIIVGIPYGPFLDPKVVLKKDCLNRNRTRENELPSGDEWYRLEAIRAVNQAIGRVIRHRNDYGAILLLDEQFSEDNIKRHISKWIKEHLTNQPSYPIPFAAITDELKQFFARAEQTLPKPEPQDPEPHLSDDDEPDILHRVKAEMIKIEPDALSHLKVESIKIEPVDLDSNDHEGDGMLGEPRVLHERKRKSSDNLSTTNDEEMLEPQPSTSTACNGIKSEDSKRTRMDDVDINMNNFDHEEATSMDEQMS